MKPLILLILITTNIFAYDWAYLDEARTLDGITSHWLETYDPYYYPLPCERSARDWDFNMDGIVNFEDWSLLWR